MHVSPSVTVSWDDQLRSVDIPRMITTLHRVTGLPLLPEPTLIQTPVTQYPTKLVEGAMTLFLMLESVNLFFFLNKKRP